MLYNSQTCTVKVKKYFSNTTYIEHKRYIKFDIVTYTGKHCVLVQATSTSNSSLTVDPFR